MDERYRPSALPRLELCPASGALPAVFGASSEAAEHGTRVHALLERAVRTGEGPAWALALLEDVDPDGTVVARTAEVHLSLDGVEGTADYVAFSPSAHTVTVCDWKTGRTPVYPDSAQLAWYALAIAALNPEVAQVRVVVAQLAVSEDLTEATWAIRERTLDVLDLVIEQARLERVRRRYLDVVQTVQAGRTPDVREGEHCTYCPAWGSCPAKARAVATLVQAGEPAAIVVTPETAGRVYHAIAAMRVVLDDAERAVKELAKTAPVPLPDGRELWAVEEQRESVVDVDAAVRVVAETYGEDDARGLVEVKRSLPKGKLEALAKRHAEGRTGTARARELVERVRAAGALKSASYLTFKVKERKAG